jgi:hypothetical protein
VEKNKMKQDHKDQPQVDPKPMAVAPPKKSTDKNSATSNMPINMRNTTVPSTEGAKEPKKKKRAGARDRVDGDLTAAPPAETDMKKKTKKSIRFEDKPTREGAIYLQKLDDLRQRRGLDKSKSEDELHKRTKSKRKHMAEHLAPPPSDDLPPDNPPDDVHPDPPPTMRDKAPHGVEASASTRRTEIQCL